MKKLILLFVVLALAVVACQDSTEEITPNQEINAVDMSDFYVYTDDDGTAEKSSNGKDVERCYSMQVLNRQLYENPGLYQKMYNIEKHTRKFIAGKGKPPGAGGGNGGGNGGGGGGGDPTPYTGTVTIPVIVNIIELSQGDVTQGQITSQIDVLNEDYNNNNSNTDGAPAEFEDLVADADVTFVLAGTKRRTSTKTNWSTDNSMKYASQGGIDATDTSKNLNIWVVNNMTSGQYTILGYAQFPGGASATDGVVLGKPYFGVTGGNYGGGRTATHEVGHWLNLRHIWGDGRCKQDDFVSDTPSSDRSNGGCPSYPTVHCRSADMTMNYMDYTNDDCMYMFTNGQNDRMRALFASGGARESFVATP